MFRLILFIIFLSNNVFAQGEIPSYLELKLHTELSEIKSNLENDITTRSIGSNIYKNNAPKTAIILTPASSGTGALVSRDGLLVTNYHVIANNEGLHPLVMVGFCTSKKYDSEASDTIFTAEIVSYIKEKDLALLKLKGTTSQSINDYGEPYSIENNIDNVLIGDDVHAIGNPQGENCTYTRGFVSQIRDNYTWSYDNKREHTANVIQTQTPINPGNSGGPLISNDGKIIGINSFKRNDSPGLNYAVSSDEVFAFINNPPVITKKFDKNNCEYANEGKIEETDNYILRKWDRDCDNYFEREDVDYNKDGYYDEYYYDNNKNLKIEQIIIWVKKNDKWVLQFKFDTDEDGVFEKECIDLNDNKKQDVGECKNI